MQACSSCSRSTACFEIFMLMRVSVNILYYGGKSCSSMVHNTREQTVIMGITIFNLVRNHVCKYVSIQLALAR